MRSEDSGTTRNEIFEKLIDVRRTAKVVSGGRVFGFSALVVVGNGAGKAGYAIRKAKEVPIAIAKATESARLNMIQVNLKGTTLHHPVKSTHASSTIIMLPASEGTGIIAGSAMRAVFEVVGIENVLSKCIGSSNPINVVHATFKGLQAMETPESMATKRGKTVNEILGIEE